MQINMKTNINKEQISGLKKISSPKKECTHLEHKPPMFYLYDPGTYEYVCPGCGHVYTFTVPEVTN